MDATLTQIHQNPPPISPAHSHSTSNSSFPILAVAVIGILATAILLVAYYIFVIKCCLNWHRFDLLTRFSFSARRRHRPPISLYSPGIQKRGLDQSVIQSIPTFEFPALVKDGNFSECAVCLNEFRPGEKLRALPNCGHLFHVDCIDVWLQGNINCPLCRTSISINAHRPPFNQTVSDQISGTDSDENYVVIELEREITPTPPLAIRPPTQPKKLNHVLSMGDEWIDMREKDDRFLVQPMRRSFSMDSASDRLLCLAVQGILQRQGHSRNGDSGSHGAEVNAGDGLLESRVKRSIFSFGHGRGSRNAILPLPNLGP